MPLYKVRIQLPDRPGSLAAIASALAAAGGNIEGFEIRELDADSVVDEVLVRLPPAVELDSMLSELRAAGALRVTATRTDRRGHADRVTLALAAVAAVLQAPSGAQRWAATAAAAAELVPDTRAQVFPVSELAADPAMARLLTGTGDAVTARLDGAPGCRLAVRDPIGAGLVCVLTRSMNVGFNAADADRVRALLRVAAGLPEADGTALTA